MSAKAEHYDVIRKPIITEKSTMASENGAVVFEVAIDSNKPQIKEAVEETYGVSVKKVRTMNSVRREGQNIPKPVCVFEPKIYQNGIRFTIVPIRIAIAIPVIE